MEQANNQLDIAFILNSIIIIVFAAIAIYIAYRGIKKQHIKAVEIASIIAMISLAIATIVFLVMGSLAVAFIAVSLPLIFYYFVLFLISYSLSKREKKASIVLTFVLYSLFIFPALWLIFGGMESVMDSIFKDVNFGL